jgi:hypothetical protein
MTRHAIDRARKRYGLELTMADIDAMVAKVRAGDFERQIPTQGGMLVEIEHEGQRLVACWNVEAQRIVTIYPLKAVERDRRKKPIHLSKAIRAAARAEAEYEREGRR